MLLFSEAERHTARAVTGTGCHKVFVGLLGIRKEDGQEVEKLK